MADKVAGYALLFNSESRDMGFVETIAPGALDGADMGDVVAIFNHNPDNLLARTLSGTLVLKVDSMGLHYQGELPDSPLGENVRAMLRRGDLRGSSFAFKIAPDGDEWTVDETRDVVVRRITKFEAIYDASPVVNPAYPATTARLVA